MTFDEWFDDAIWGNEDFKDCLRRAWDASAKAEREACAKVCVGHAADASFLYGDYANGCENEALACAAAIRMRSNAKLKGATDD